MISPKISETTIPPVKLGSSPIADYADSLRYIAFVYGGVNAKLSEVLAKRDSLRIANRNNDLKLVSYAFGRVNSRLPSAIAQQDSLRLVEVARVNSLKRQIKVMSADSLKHELKINKYEDLKLPLYTELASRYLNYDTISNRRIRLNYQNEAINYTMLALHKYSKLNDTVGLRTSFDNLAKVYFAQKKHSQAKWFILQSNTISRAKKDTLNIVLSLVTLSAIKADIKDYKLAMKDLNDALRLSRKNHLPKLESGVLINYALLYSRLKNYPAEAVMLKKRDSVEDKIRKDEEARLVARTITIDSLKSDEADSLASKKKVYTFTIKKLYKSSSSRKTASL